MPKDFKVVVLDDDEEDFILFRDVIEECYDSSCDIRHFASKKQLYDGLADFEADLCFVDYKLGNTKGTQVIADLNQSHAHLPCILLTGLDDPDIDFEASQSGAYEYLSKGDIEAKLLERTIRYVLKNAEQRNQLEEERQRLELVIQESPDPMISYDEKGQLRNVSKSFFDLSGIDPSGETVNTIDDWVNLVYSGDLPEADRFIQRLISAAEDRRSINFTIRHTSGRMMLWRFKTVEIGRTREGDILYVTIAIDITRLTNALKQAEAANKAKTDFLSVISHELRTPLNPIIGLTEIIKEEVDQPEVIDMLNIIHNSGNDLLRLIEDLLDYTSSDMENFELIEQPFCFEAVVNTCLDTLERDFSAGSIDLNINYLKGVADIEEMAYIGDAGRIQQVLLNLLKNALKFTPKGSVSMSFRCDECEANKHFISIEIEDTGIGISSENLERIFEPLYQVDGSTTRSQQGTGLGLAICKRLIHQMQGEIGVQSQLGEGTKFTIKIPLRVADVLEEPIVEISTNNRTMEGKVLVAEDAYENMVYVTRLLEQLGFEVLEANNGHEAISQFDSDPENIRFVFMDLQMPLCDGYEATRALRSRDDRGRTVPIIAVTANAGANVEIICQKTGMDAFLEKPFSRSKLVDTINRFSDDAQSCAK